MDEVVGVEEMIPKADEEGACFGTEDEISQNPRRDFVRYVSNVPEKRIIFLAFVDLPVIVEHNHEIWGRKILSTQMLQGRLPSYLPYPLFCRTIPFSRCKRTNTIVGRCEDKTPLRPQITYLVFFREGSVGASVASQDPHPRYLPLPLLAERSSFSLVYSFTFF